MQFPTQTHTLLSGSASLTYSFKCNGKRGATLVLGSWAKQELFHRNVRFRDYMYRHHASWYALVRAKGLDIRRDDIIFVSGCVKAAQWAITVFGDAGAAHAFAFSAPGGSVVASKFEFATETQTTASAAQRAGPVRASVGGKGVRQEEGPKDQCLFLRYYKVKYRPMLSTPSVVEEPLVDDSQGCSHGVPRCCASYCSAVCYTLAWPCRQCGSGACGECCGKGSSKDAVPTDVAMSVHEVPTATDTQARSATSDHLRF